MTSSKPTLSDFLQKNDFAEMATEQKRQMLIKKKEEQDRLILEESERKEQERLAALPKITEEDLKKAEESGYEKGLLAGQEQTTAALNIEFEANLGKMQEQLSHLPNLLKEEVSYIQKQALTFMKDILGKILQNAQEKYSEEVLEFMLNEALSKAPEDTNIIVRLSSADRFYLQEKGAEIVKNSTVKFKEDESIKRGDCFIEWDNSGIDARFQNILNEIDTFIQAAHDHVSPENITLIYKEQEAKTAQETQEAQEIQETELSAQETETPEEITEDKTVDVENNVETDTKESQKPSEPVEKNTSEPENSSEDVTLDDENKTE
jgi:flagellar biosynthesis/type III secretory pathway protein FliH